MELKFSHAFTVRLNSQLDYIAKDRPLVASKFKKDLINALKGIPKMPYKHRKSIYFDSDDIRDLVFKNHVIVYQIDKIKNQIQI